jgi:hypothetical protein
MNCQNENDDMDTKFAQPCKKGHKFCLEDRCPDYKPKVSHG